MRCGQNWKSISKIDKRRLRTMMTRKLTSAQKSKGFVRQRPTPGDVIADPGRSRVVPREAEGSVLDPKSRYI